MAKRPQQPQIQIPDVSTSVQATPVNTFVAPGKAGMPTAPVSVPMPVPASNQSVVDMQNLAQSFGMLSNAIGRLGQAEARGDNAMSEWGERQAELVDLEATKKGYGLAFAEGVSKGAIDALEHPAAAAALSKGIMLRLNRDADLEMEAGFDEESVSNPNFTDPLYMESKFDKQTQEVMDKLPPGIPRSDVAIDTWIKARSKSRVIFKAKHDKWLSNRAIEDAELSLKEGVTREVDETMIMEPAVRFEVTNPIKGKSIIEVESEKELEARKLESLTATISDQLDGAKGGLFTPKVNNEIVGMFLVDMARESNDPEKAALILKALRSAQTGPLGNRGKLNSGKTKIYHDKHLASIERNIARGRAGIKNDQWLKAIDGERKNLVEVVFESFLNSNKIVTKENFKADMQRAWMGGNREVSIDGGTLRLNGSGDVVVTPDANSGITSGPVTLQFEALFKEGQTAAFNKIVNDEYRVLSHVNELDASAPKKIESELRMEAVALAAARLPGFKTEELNASLNSTWTLLSPLRQQMAEEQVPIDNTDGYGEVESQIRAGYAAYKTLRSSGQVKQYIPNENSRSKWTMIDLLMTNPEIMRSKGGSWTRTLATMSSPIASSDNPYTDKQYDEEFDEVGTQFPSLNKIHNGPIKRERIMTVAYALTQLDIVPDLNDAMRIAMQSELGDLVPLGNAMVNPEDLDPNFFSTNANPGIPEDKVPTKYDRGSIGNLLFIAYEANRKASEFIGLPVPAKETDAMNKDSLFEWISSGIETSILSFTEGVMMTDDAIRAGWGWLTDDPDLQRSQFELRQQWTANVANAAQNQKIKMTNPEIIDHAIKGIQTNPPDWWSDENGGTVFSEIIITPVNHTKGGFTGLFKMQGTGPDELSQDLINPKSKTGLYAMSDLNDLAVRAKETPGWFGRLWGTYTEWFKNNGTSQYTEIAKRTSEWAGPETDFLTRTMFPVRLDDNDGR